MAGRRSSAKPDLPPLQPSRCDGEGSTALVRAGTNEDEMHEVTESQFFAAIKTMGAAGRDPMPSAQSGFLSFWKDRGQSVVGKTTTDGCGANQFFLA